MVRSFFGKLSAEYESIIQPTSQRARILAKGSITVSKKPLKVEQLQQTVRILGQKDAARLAA
jgi:hypothetical protein